MDYPLIESLEDIKILLVDDDAFIQQLLETVLVDLGFKQIIKADDGQQALDILNNHSIDLLLTDIQMPNMNGLELLKQVRCGNTGVPSNLRSIIITSLSNLQTLGVAIALDVNGFLDKPFKPVTVIKKILLALSEDEQSQRPEEDYQGIITDIQSVSDSGHIDMDELLEEEHDYIDNMVAKTPGEPALVDILKPGVKLPKDVRTDDGSLLLPKGFLLTRQSIHRIHEISDALKAQELGVEPKEPSA